jgi:hypothetical protein
LIDDGDLQAVRDKAVDGICWGDGPQPAVSPIGWFETGIDERSPIRVVRFLESDDALGRAGA